EGAFTQGQGWATIEESLWLRHNGALFTQGPGAYKLPGFSDIPQVFNVSLLRDAEWPNLGSIKESHLFSSELLLHWPFATRSDLPGKMLEL
ncbi:hypothetical protein H0H87_003461, partial [Tephrocybe sp. NHM501043]